MPVSLKLKIVFVILLLSLIPLSAAIARADILIEKKVLLTFDDGPNPLYTPETLAILKKNNIKAVFFVVGQEVTKYPNLLKKIDNDGHLIGNHTFSHRVIDSMNERELTAEITETDQIIKGIIGKSPIFFRPPTGAYTEQQAKVLRQLKKPVLMWDFGLEKKDIHTAHQLVDYLMQRIENENKKELILLLHDGDPSETHSRDLTIEALPILIDELRAKGFVFINPLSPEGRTLMNDFAKNKPKIGVY